MRKTSAAALFITMSPATPAAAPRTARRPGPPIPIPPLTAIARMLRGLESERMFHRILANLLGDRANRTLDQGRT